MSRQEQDLDENRTDILALANREDLGRVEFVEEKASGTIADVLEEFREGDALVVSALSRLGRSMLECMAILSIAANAGIKVYAIKGSWSLDETIQSRIIAMAFSMGAEIERDLLSARTREAVRARKPPESRSDGRKGQAKASSIRFVPRSRRCSRTVQPRRSSRSAATRCPATSRTG